MSVVGLHPPLSWTSLEAAERRALFADVADAGIPHVAVGDHIGFRKQHGFDGLINATAILAAEPRLAVALAVYLLPHRHPVLVARQLSTLAELAPGRLVFGVGVGGEDPGEARMCGIENEGRGKRADESLALLRRLLAGETVTAAGAYYQLDDVYVGPPPRCGISVLVGGRSDAAIRRAAIHGDGWLGLWASPGRFGQVVKEIGAMARAEGRDHPSRARPERLVRVRTGPAGGASATRRGNGFRVRNPIRAVREVVPRGRSRVGSGVPGALRQSRVSFLQPARTRRQPQAHHRRCGSCRTVPPERSRIAGELTN